MSTWTQFYVETDNKSMIVGMLKSLTGISEESLGAYPEDMYDNYLFNEDAKPSYLAIASISPHWITVSHNSFNRLTDWGEILSKKLDTKVIVTIAQSVSDGYYFSMYDKGKMVREIEVCYSEDFKPKNFGQRFAFENEQPGSKTEYGGEIEYYFGFEEIEDYCRHFGLAIQNNFSDYEWTILKNGIKQPTINDFIQQQLVKKKKAWWRFW